MPAESKEELLLVIQLIEKNFVSNPAILPEDSCFSLEDQSAIFLGHSIYWPWEWNWFGLNKKHSKPKTFSTPEMNYQALINAQKAEVQLELPPKMAAGFACILGGALICIIPGGQAVGLTLIGTGVGLTFDGMANGERPYYVDSGTSQEFP